MWAYGPQQLGYNYVGAGNPKFNKVPKNKLDWAAYWHDRRYKTRWHYFFYNGADEQFLTSIKDIPGPMAAGARMIFGAKRILAPALPSNKRQKLQSNVVLPDEKKPQKKSMSYYAPAQKYFGKTYKPKKSDKKKSVKQQILAILNPPQQTMRSNHIGHAIPLGTKYYIDCGMRDPSAQDWFTFMGRPHCKTLVDEALNINSNGPLYPNAEWWILESTRLTEITNLSNQVAFIKIHKLIPKADTNVSPLGLMIDMYSRTDIFPNGGAVATSECNVVVDDQIGSTKMVLSEAFKNPVIMGYLKKYFHYECTKESQLQPQTQMSLKQKISKPFLYCNQEDIDGAEYQFFKGRTEFIYLEVVGATSRGASALPISAANVPDGSQVIAAPLTINIAWRDIGKVANRLGYIPRFKNNASAINPAQQPIAAGVVGMDDVEIL